MGVAMAGSRGGIIRDKKTVSDSSFIERLLTAKFSFEELKSNLVTRKTPITTTLVVNNSCNLSCAHCYLRVKELTATALNENEWKKVIDSVSTVDNSLICLSGKEVFLGNIGARLLSYLSEIKKQSKSLYRIGLITNGTLVHKHKENLLEAQPSYFDISVDGLESDHDAVRGHGALAKTLPNVEWAAQTFNHNFFVSHTLQKQNYNKLKEIVSFLSEKGVTNISCGFYRPLSYTNKSLVLSEGEIDEIFAGLSSLSEIPDLDRQTKILFDLDTIQLTALKSFIKSKWFVPKNIQKDANGEYFIEYTFGNNLSLEFRFAPYPTGVWKSVRITAEGNYLAAEDTIDTDLYSKHSIGNVRDFDYDFAALHKSALKSERFNQILRNFYFKILPELQSAYNERNLSLALS